MNRTLLIDGDMIAYHTSFKNEDVERRAVAFVRRCMTQLSGNRAIVCFSDASRRYFRHDLFEGYKKNHSLERPEGYDAAKAALLESFVSREIPGLEADDVIGVLATTPIMTCERVIVAVDKDLLTVPGLHFNPKAGARGVVQVSELDADFNHLRQAIVGDSGDGYPGCPGVGEEKVKRILWGDRGQWWRQTVMAFHRHGLTEADALLQARLARICRWSEWDSESKEVIPWTPEPPVAKEAA